MDSQDKNQTACMAVTFAVLLFLSPSHAFSESPAPAPAQVSVASIIQTYDQLLEAIREVRAESQKRIEKAVEAEKVREAWETGRLIDAHVLQHKERADYGKKVLLRLANDLGTSPTELRYMLRFFRNYPIQPSTAELSWSHYRELLSINDEEARKKVADEAVRQNWSEKRLRAEVRARQLRPAVLSDEQFPPEAPGKVYTYRVVKAAEGPYRGELCVDLGFSNYFRPDGIGQFKEGDNVTLENGELKKARASEGTYNAYVTQIIDGDTFHAIVDLGFDFVTEQKLRLRGLDAPPVESADGREAKAFLESHGVRPGARILVKTTKSDKYDRYLVDVWLPLRSDKASSGGAQTTRDEQWIYINQKLFDEGLAVSVSD